MALRFERFASAGFKDFDNIVELYRSTTGAVFCGKYKYDNVIYVLKERKVSELGKKKDVMNEVRLLSQLNHPYVIGCEGWFSDEERQSLFIILEYCPGGDLSKKIELRKKSRRYFSEQYIWFIFHQLCLGLQHLHANGIIHRDLKTLNVVLSKKDTMVKIADLGVSRQVSRNTSMLDTFIGTPLYLSPELVDNKPYNEKTDLWSLGVMLYELCSLTVPFKAQNVLTLANMIRAAKYEPIPGIYSTAMERCIPWLLNVNYLNRPTINQVIAYVEDKLTAGYHGEDMAAEYDTVVHTIGGLIQPPGSHDRHPALSEGQKVEPVPMPGNNRAGQGIALNEGQNKPRRSIFQDNSDSEEDISDDSLTVVTKHSSALSDEKSKSEHKKYHKRRPQTANAAVNSNKMGRQSSEDLMSHSRKDKSKQVSSEDNGGVQVVDNASTMVQFEVSRISILLRREMNQLSRLLKLKEFFEASTVGVVQPINIGAESQPADSNIDVKLRQVKERIRILERCLQNKGVLTRMEIKKIDALNVLVKLQDDPIIPHLYDESDPDPRPKTAGDKKSKKHGNKPIKYKKLRGRHRQQDDDEEEEDGLVPDVLEEDKPEQNYMSKMKQKVQDNEARLRKLEVMKYENPFEAVAVSKEMFKQKNLDYNLFVHDDVVNDFSQLLVDAKGLKDMSGKRVKPMALAADISDAETEAGDEETDREEDAPAVIPAPVSAPTSAVSESRLDGGKAGGVIVGNNKLPVEVSAKTEAPWKLPAVSAPPPAAVDAYPSLALDIANFMKREIISSNVDEHVSASNLPTPRSMLPAPSIPILPVINAKVPEKPAPVPVPVSLAQAVPLQKPAQDLPSHPPLHPKAEVDAPQKDPITSYESRNKVAGKIGNKHEDVKYEKIYLKPAHPRKKIGYSFENEEIEINWFPGVNVHNNVPPVEVFVKEPVVPSPTRGVTVPKRHSRKNVVDIHDTKPPNHHIGKRFNIITGTYE